MIHIGMNTCSCTKADGRRPYELPDLPYGAGELEPLLDAETLCLHHDRHHAAYVAGANAALETLRGIARDDIPETEAADATRRLCFHLSGHLLHCLYWRSMAPEPRSAPSAELIAALDAQYGSFDAFCRLFRGVTLGIQGNGWGVLGYEPVGGRLLLCGVYHHQDAFIAGLQPLLVCDVWEHAYYLRYCNNRTAYVDAFMRQIDWLSVSERFNKVTCVTNHENDGL